MPLALRFEAWQGKVWRLIEGQYRPATLKIVDSAGEQDRLEALLEASKPAIPPECAHLDYQFSAPFRYGLYPHASRFRRPGRTPGVFYAAESPLTAALESAWWLVRFYRASPGTPLPTIPTAHTAILAEVQVPLAVDLTAPDNATLARWDDPEDYTDCLDMAESVRAQGCEAIRYASARDPRQGRNLAVLSCRAFAKPQPVDGQSWHLYLMRERVVLTNETLRQRYEYGVGEVGFVRAQESG